MWAYNYTNPDIIAHYGVKGMRWGIRKDYSGTSSLGDTRMDRHFASIRSKDHFAKAKQLRAKAKQYGADSRKGQRLQKKAAKLTRRATHAKNYVNALNDYDKKYTAVRKSMSRGERIFDAATAQLFGQNRPYSSLRALGVSKGKAAVAAVLGGPFGSGMYVSRMVNKDIKRRDTEAGI